MILVLDNSQTLSIRCTFFIRWFYAAALDHIVYRPRNWCTKISCSYYEVSTSEHEMKDLLRLFGVIMIKELYRLFSDWRRLFLIVATFTSAGLVYQSLTLSHPLGFGLLTEPAVVSQLESLNTSFELSKVRSVRKIEEVLPLPAAPIISFNASVELRQPPPVAEAKVRRKSRRRRRRDVVELTVTPPPPPPRVPPSLLQRYVWSLPPDEALAYARRELEHAPIVVDDPDLFTPIFRNVSLFKRSYELMELILKVYVYPDGKRPIFHEPHLRGIYASEGWFMKLMEENRQFGTKDPTKAHLFYLPYSVRQLQQSLYVPNSHSLRPLSIYLKNHVNYLAAKYPFWNRTHGSDHFLVACHDWGPYTVTEHEELKRNAIKVLCNADLSERIFSAGNDVSLPETTIRTPRKPRRYIGGLRVSQRPILAFFAGYLHGRVRPVLLKHWGGKDKDMRIYGPLPARITRNMTYIQHMKSSKYCICPMGFEVNSPRIVEAIYYECVPVIIADNFVLPFSHVLDWSAFSVVVAEKDIPKLKDILTAIPLRRYLKMQLNVKMVQKHFLWHPRPVKYDLFHMILHSIWLSRLNQIQLPDAMDS